MDELIKFNKEENIDNCVGKDVICVIVNSE